MLSDSGRNSKCHCAGWYLGPWGDDGTSAHKRSRAADDSFEDHRARTDEDQVLENAAFEMCQVADHTVRPDPGLVLGLGMDDGAVLNGGSSANDDRTIVRTDDGPWPDT
jgi:hypothetical protein